MMPFVLNPTARPWWRLAAALAVAVTLLLLAVLFFPWDWLRGPVNRFVSEQTGRRFEITRRLDVQPGWTTRVRLDGVQFANPEWARNPYLVQAESAEFELRLLPLLRGRLELGALVLRQPKLGLQMEADGRRTWALGRDTADTSTVPVIGSLQVDRGELQYLALAQGIDIRTTFTVDPSAANSLPMRFEARGTFKRQPFSARGRTGSVLVLHAPLAEPFPLEVQALAGTTSLNATGTLATLAGFQGLDAAFELKGASLADLYRLVGVVLPATPRYALGGRLALRGREWHLTQIRGHLGQSDMAGDLVYQHLRPVAMLSGKLQSRVLDFDDLAPLVGMKPGAAAGPPGPGHRMLPATTLDLQRLKAMNAQVHWRVTRITHARALPLDSADVQVRLQDGVLDLAPLQLGVAGGQMTGALRINALDEPARVSVKLTAKGLRLGQLLPAVEATRGSEGRLHGQVALAGAGNSVARMLATASGDMALLMGGGQISNLLLEYLGLDGAEIIKFKLGGDRKVTLRCAAAAFDVKQGLMSSRAIVLDTTDTVIQGTGTISLADETLDLTLRPAPKDTSILSMRSPLRISGTFAAPRAGVDKAAVAGRLGLALALGALNPLLALAATVETGPGVDTNCAQMLAQAAAPAAAPKGATRP